MDAVMVPRRWSYIERELRTIAESCHTLSAVHWEFMTRLHHLPVFTAALSQEVADQVRTASQALSTVGR